MVKVYKEYKSKKFRSERIFTFTSWFLSRDSYGQYMIPPLLFVDLKLSCEREMSSTNFFFFFFFLIGLKPILCGLGRLFLSTRKDFIEYTWPLFWCLHDWTLCGWVNHFISGSGSTEESLIFGDEVFFLFIN